MADNVTPLLRPYQEPKHFHQRLRHIRVVRGLSQSELAKLADLHASAVAHFESGSRLPSFENIRALAIALRCTADYLLGLSPSPAEHIGDPVIMNIMFMRADDREYVDLFVRSVVERREKIKSS